MNMKGLKNFGKVRK